MYFCGRDNFSAIWVDQGLSHCFLDTVCSSILFSFIVIFGSVQLLFYRKFATAVDDSYITASKGYVFQQVLSLLLVFEPIVDFLLHATYFDSQKIYIYNILVACFNCVSWILAMILLSQERHRMLPTILSRGHGLVILTFWSLSFVKENLAFLSWSSPLWFWHLNTTDDRILFGLWLFRYVSMFLLFALGIVAPGIPRAPPRPGDDEPLLDPTGDSPQQRSNRNRTSTWAGLWGKLQQIWPYMWPRHHFRLQLQVLMCVVILVGGRVVNLYVPIYSKKIIDQLTARVFCWELVSIFVGMKLLQGSGGLLSNMRSFLWISVQQYTTRGIQLNLFEHLHGLSMRWHLSRKTGEVLRVVDRGTTSITSLLNYLVFSILPTIADIIIAVVYFVSSFDALFGLIVFITMAGYLAVTIGVTEWRTKFRREMNTKDNNRNAKAVDSLINFETVKYYGAEKYEVERYREAILTYQHSEFKSLTSLNFLNTTQNITINMGLLAGSLLCAKYVSTGKKDFTVGDYVLFTQYIGQLYQPLNFLGTVYRVIQQAFIDMENMFDLLEQHQEVKDIPEAPDMTVRRGELKFDKVCFSYTPEKPILKDVSFTVPSGCTYALVGPSGSGKSTIIRLLFRFYDIDSGSIQIDGSDVRHVTQHSLRQSIGVVPQDTVLFNDDIRYNIRYGRAVASDQSVEEAAAAADIHNRILTFPEGYQTIVGERGLKLSGGEKQRVAIARTLLKAPAIVLLDEATSALDTQTERNIQASLQKVCENRTTLIVAHRLSTIVSADQILVLREGEVIERGTHDKLLQLNGTYAAMWVQQSSSSDAALTSSSDS